jgi:hypothetical protein
MSNGNHSTAATNGVDKAYENNDLPPRRPAEPTVVEVRTSIRRRGWLPSLLSKLSCRRSRSISDSIHFHAQRIQDVSKLRISVSFCRHWLIIGRRRQVSNALFCDATPIASPMTERSRDAQAR